MATESISIATTEPQLDLLIDEWKRCSPDRNQFVQWADDVRLCRWPNQYPDGKKHTRGDHEAFPWDGASDTQPLVADRIINEQVALLTGAFWRAVAKPGAASDEAGEYAVTLADHFVTKVLYNEMIREVELAAQYCQTYGWYVFHPGWSRQLALKRRTVTLQELDALGKRLMQQFPDRQELGILGQLILSPELEEAAIETLRFIYSVFARQGIADDQDIEIPDLPPKMLRRALTTLRSETQSADIVVPYIARNGPTIAALRPYDEIFVPTDTTELNCARAIFQREWVTEAELRSRILTDRYDSKWVEEAIRHKGESAAFWSIPQGIPGSAVSNSNSVTQSQPFTTGHNLIEVLHCTHRSVDDDNVPGIYLTTLHPLVTKNAAGKPLYARHELVDYPHGEYPYVGGCREFTSRRFTGSRGVPEIVHARQAEKKALLDATIDRTSITVVPPLNLYPAPHGARYRFGPAVQNTVQPGREPKFMDMPSGSGMNEATVTIERIDYEIDSYFGLTSEKVPPQRSALVQGNHVQKFLLTCSKALQQLVSLAQQHMSDAEFARITGAPMGWLDSRRDKTGLLTVELEFDVRELDPDLLQARIEAMNKVVLPTDVAGVIDRTKWVQLQLRAINPTWARELVMPQQAASQQIYDGVRNDIAQMFLGNEAKYVENDPTSQVKLQYASQIVQSNPNYQTALQQGGRFAELMKKWSDNLQFSLTQQQNKMVGAIGVKPMQNA